MFGPCRVTGLVPDELVIDDSNAMASENDQDLAVARALRYHPVRLLAILGPGLFSLAGLIESARRRRELPSASTFGATAAPARAESAVADLGRTAKARYPVRGLTLSNS